MGYIPYTYAPFEDSGTQTLNVGIACNGVMLSEKDGSFFDDRCAYAENVDFSCSGLSTRKDFGKIVESLGQGGRLYSCTKTDFFSKAVLHIGSCLYAFDGENEDVTVISEDMPDQQSIFCEFLSKLYIYCDRRVFSLDKDFVLTSEIPYAPVLFKDCMPSAAHLCTLDTTVPLNMLCPIIEVEYRSSEATYYELPLSCDSSFGVQVLIDGALVASDQYTLSQDSVSFTSKYTYDYEKTVNIRYYVLNADEIGFTDLLYGCKACTSFGGRDLSGTRIFVTGNESCKGTYFKSELLNPLYFPSDEAEVIGDGCENVTSLVKMYGDLIIFTDRAVYKMEYSLDDELGSMFCIKQLNSYVGCDIPLSVQLIDNRIVFANSKKGIFIVDSAEMTGEQNIKPVSGNIDKGEGLGFLDNDSENMKDGFSFDFDRKYWLFVCGRAYIWDYDRSAFQGAASYAKSQGRLIWYIYTDVFFDAGFVATDKMYFLKYDNGVCIYKAVDTTTGKSIFVSGRLDFGKRQSKKLVTNMSIRVYAKDSSGIWLTLYADGKKFYKRKISCALERSVLVELKLPTKPLYGFAYGIECDTGGFEITDVAFKYKVLQS